MVQTRKQAQQLQKIQLVTRAIRDFKDQQITQKTVQLTIEEIIHHIYFTEHDVKCIEKMHAVIKNYLTNIDLILVRLILENDPVPQITRDFLKLKKFLLNLRF